MKSTLITIICTFLFTVLASYIFYGRYMICDEELAKKNYQSYIISKTKNLQIKLDSTQSELENCKINYKAVADEYLGEGNYQIK